MSPRDPRIHYHPDEFPGRVEAAREVRGFNTPAIGDEDAWGLLSRGKTIGKEVMVPFTAANSAQQAQVSLVELLRINPRGGQADQLAMQLCLTLSAPRVLPGVALNQLPADPTQLPGGTKDNIILAAAGLNGIGGIVGDSGANDWEFANPIAILSWGTGSVVHRAEVDMLNGLCVNLTAGWLTVQAQIDPGGLTTLTSGGYVLGANLGPGYPRGGAGAQRTIAVGGIANGVMSGVFTVPRFAKSVRVSASDGSSNPPVPTGTISFWRSELGSADGQGVGDFLFSGNNAEAIPIPAGAYYFSILGGYTQSGGGFVAPRYEAIFDLAI